MLSLSTVAQVDSLASFVATWVVSSPVTFENLASSHRPCACFHLTAEDIVFMEAYVTAGLNDAIVHGRKRFDGRMDRCHVSSKSDKHSIDGKAGSLRPYFKPELSGLFGISISDCSVFKLVPRVGPALQTLQKRAVVCLPPTSLALRIWRRTMTLPPLTCTSIGIGTPRTLKLHRILS